MRPGQPVCMYVWMYVCMCMCMYVRTCVPFLTDSAVSGSGPISAIVKTSSIDSLSPSRPPLASWLYLLLVPALHCTAPPRAAPQPASAGGHCIPGRPRYYMHDAAGAGGGMERAMGCGQARGEGGRERAKAPSLLVPSQFFAPVPPFRRVTGNNDAAGEAASLFTGRKQALGELLTRISPGPERRLSWKSHMGCFPPSKILGRGRGGRGPHHTHLAQGQNTATKGNAGSVLYWHSLVGRAEGGDSQPRYLSVKKVDPNVDQEKGEGEGAFVGSGCRKTLPTGQDWYQFSAGRYSMKSTV